MQTTKYVEAYFNGGLSTKTRSLYQYDYGQVLTFPDLITPLSYQVQFCNSGDTQTIEAIGNADGVAIPDDVLRAGTYINVYVFLHDTETDGETRYSIIIPVNRRPEMSDIEPTPTEQREIDQLVSALNEGVNRAETAAENAEVSEVAAHNSAELAEESASTASSAASTATTKASEASQSASSASGSATAAQTAKTGAEAAQEAAETAQEAAETAETHAKASETAAASSATSASNSATTATTKASEAAQSATSAETSATNAASSATAASGSASTASTKASQASQSATDAANSATAAGTAKTDAEAAKTAAQTAQTAAETAQGKAEDAQAAAEAAAQTLVIDTTLTQPNQAAEAKATGDAISLVKSHLEAMSTASASDEGKALIAKTVTDGTVTEWEFGETGGGGAPEIVCNASGAVASFADGSDGYAVKGLTVNVEPIQSGSGDPSPENVRPISGRQSVTAWRSGKNLFDYRDSANWRVATSSTERRLPVSGEFMLDGDILTYKRKTQLQGAVFILGYLFGGTTYTFNYSPKGQIYYAKINGDFSGRYTATRIGSGVNTFTPDTDGYYEVLIYATNQGTYEFTNLQLEEGAVETDYVPGNVKSVTIQLGDTIYGGSLDVTTGVLTVDRKFVTLDGTRTWRFSYDSETGIGQAYISSVFSSNEISSAARTPNLCNQAVFIRKESGTVTVGNFTLRSYGRTFVMGVTGITTEADWLTHVTAHPIEVCAVLNTPLTVQLTPQQLTTLKGTNNVWSDGGNVSVNYVADTKLFIEQLTEPDADMVADANITSGKYFMVANNLFLATANIASGAAITPGVNCTRTSLAAALNAINA